MKKRTNQRQKRQVTKKNRSSLKATRYYLAGGIVLAILAVALASGGPGTTRDAEAAIAALGRTLTSPAESTGLRTTTPARKTESRNNRMVFNDYPAQMREFMAYNDSIHLTADQQAIKEKALGGHPAVCCHDSSALTCCCPCNLSRSVWGLANYLIAKKGYGVKQVENAVAEWMAFTNPSGYTGDSCYVPGGCERAPRQDGCGGMDANDLVL